VGPAVVTPNDSWFEVGIARCKEVALDTVFCDVSISGDGGPASDGWAFDPGNGKVSGATMGEVGLEGEDIVAGLKLPEVIAVSERLDRAVGCLQMKSGEGDKAVTVENEWSPVVDDHLLARLGDDFNIS
jgi:hypothetical protein